MFIVPALWADGPRFKHSDVNVDQEFVNVYQDIRSASGGTTDPLVVSTATITSSATIRGVLNMSGNKIVNVATGTVSGDAVHYGQLKILQWIQGTTATQFITTSNSYQATGLTASITPVSASNQVLILCHCSWQINTAGVQGFITIKRGATDIGDASGGGFQVFRSGSNGTSPTNGASSIVFIDAPATTSSTAYSIHVKNADNATTVVWPLGGNTCSLILGEVVRP